MSKRMIFFPPRRRGPGLRAIATGAILMSLTGASFAAGLHVGATYGVPGESPRALISAAIAPPAR